MSEPQYITLQAWAERRYDPVPHRNTLQRWANEGMIVPAAVKRGNRFMVSPNARHISEPATGSSLVERMHSNGLAPA